MASSAAASGGPGAVPGTPAVPLPLADSASNMPVADPDRALQLGLRGLQGKQPLSGEWREAADLWNTQATVSDEVLLTEVGKLPPGSRPMNVHYTHVCEVGSRDCGADNAAHI